jgi:hypothetical protein
MRSLALCLHTADVRISDLMLTCASQDLNSIVGDYFLRTYSNCNCPGVCNPIAQLSVPVVLT